MEVTVINLILILSSITITIISVTRLLIVSNYQAPIAITLYYSSGTVNTLTGTLLPLVPALLPIITQLLAICTFGAVLFDSKMRFHLFLVTVTAFIATVFVAPSKVSIQDILHGSPEIVRSFEPWVPWVLMILFATFVVVAFIGLRVRLVKFAIGSAFIAILMVIIVTVPTVASYSLPSPSEIQRIPDVLRRVWLPAELIGTKNGSVRVGYILKTDPSWTTIFWDSDRSIVIIKNSDITSRKICRIGPPDELPLISAQFSEVPKIEPCESSVVTNY